MTPIGVSHAIKNFKKLIESKLNITISDNSAKLLFDKCVYARLDVTDPPTVRNSIPLLHMIIILYMLHLYLYIIILNIIIIMITAIVIRRVMILIYLLKICLQSPHRMF